MYRAFGTTREGIAKMFEPLPSKSGKGEGAADLSSSGALT